MVTKGYESRMANAVAQAGLIYDELSIDHTSEKDLVEAAREGDQSAFRSLYLSHRSEVHRIVFRLLGPTAELEDIIQDVFLQVHRSLGSFRGNAKFSTWLYTIAYRTAIDYTRRRQSPSVSIEDDATYIQIEDEELRSPLQRMHDQDLSDQLKAAIDLLKPVDATIVTLFYLHENTVNEISDITGLTVSNVKTKLHRLRESLRSQLSRQLKEEIQDML